MLNSETILFDYLYLSANDISHNKVMLVLWVFLYSPLLMITEDVNTLFMAYVNVILNAKYRKMGQKAKLR